MDSTRSRTIGTILLLLATACSSGSSSGSTDDATPSFGGSPTPPAASTPGAPQASSEPQEEPDPPGPPLDPAVDPATHSNPEAVQVLMKDWDGNTWFCTGTLVAADVVITAGHCLDASKFASVEVKAPTLASHPTVKASRFAVYDDQWEDVGHPDLGMVKLESAIELGRYATLTDVTSSVDGGKALSVGAIVRTQEKPEAPFKKVGPFPLTSATPDGYPHSYSVPMFSAGGDSGAGMFLVENGKTTHKMVAVEHTPDPARAQDHVSRVDAAFIQWVADQSAGR